MQLPFSSVRLAARALLCACVLVSSLLALDPSKRLTQYGLETWETKQGLPQNSVQAVLQTSDGYLWVGTQEGLTRFDGVRFTIFDARNTPGIANHFIWNIFEARDHTLWIGTSGGLVRYRNGEFKTLTTADGLGSNVVRVVSQAPDGTLWIGTTGGVSAGGGEKFRVVATMGHGLKHNTVRGLVAAHDGSVWVGTSGGGITQIKLAGSGDGQFTTFTKAEGLDSDFVYPVFEDHDHTIWFGTDEGLLRIGKDGKPQRVTTFPRGFVRTITQDRHGDLWVGASNGLHRIQGERVDSFTTKQGLHDGEVLSLAEDHEGNMWAGTLGGGLNRLRDGSFVTYTTQEGLRHNFVRSIYQEPSGVVWVATWGGGLNRYDQGKFSAITEVEGLASDYVWTLHYDSNGDLWAGTSDGLNRVHGGRVTGTFTTAQGLPTNLIRSIYRDSSGTLWVGTDGGVARFDGKRFINYSTTDGLSNDTVFSIYEDRQKNLWIGTRAGLDLIRDNKIADFPFKKALADVHIKSFYEDDAGALWIGTGTVGLVRVKDGVAKHVGVKNGLFDDVVHQILPDGRGNLWMSSNKGIFYASISDLNDYFDGRSQHVSTVGFDQADGMKTSECNTGQPAGWRMQDGTLWFPTIQGIASLDPANIALPTGTFQVQIESVVNNGTALDLRAPGLTIAPGDGRFEFNYTALSYTAPERIHFRYMLEGLDRTWIDAGRRRTAYYTNVPPGKYTFRVMASLRDGVWNPVQGVVTFDLKPRFYQTRWFFVMLALVVAGSWFLWHRASVRRLKERETELAAMEKAFAERAKAEHELAASETRYRNLVESAVYGIFRASPDCMLLEANRAFRRIIGYNESDSIRDVNVVKDLSTDPAEHERIKSQLTSGRIENQETHWRRKDGRVITVRLSGRANRNETGEIDSFEVIVEDVTERRALEEQLRQAQKMDAVGKLAGGIAHDFNNLMTVVLGYTDVLMDELPKKGASTQEMEEIRKAAKRAADLTAQLLAFSRRQVLAPKVLYLNDVITEMEKLLVRLLPENITLENSLASNLWCVKADPGQIEQVLMNLAVNARDAMPHGGRIRIETENREVKRDTSDMHAGKYVVVRVRDEGSGIPPAVLPRIFEPFFTTKEQGKGTGLGLSTVYGILKQSGGHIEVQSKVGEGATFTMYLPASETERARTAESAPTVANGGKETVLVVEDEEGVRSLITLLLRRSGYVVHEAADPRTALAIGATQKDAIDLVLTDMVLGEMSGRELAKQLKTMLPSAAFIFMSGYTDVPLEHDEEHFIAKPFTNASLLDGVRQVLDARVPKATAARSL